MADDGVKWTFLTLGEEGADRGWLFCMFQLCIVGVACCTSTSSYPSSSLSLDSGCFMLFLATLFGRGGLVMEPFVLCLAMFSLALAVSGKGSAVSYGSSSFTTLSSVVF